MPVQIIDDALTVEVHPFRPIPMRFAEEDKHAYPWLRLEADAGIQPQNVPALRLENGLTRIWICPSLGGRVLQAQDVRSGAFLWQPASPLLVEKSGRRGVGLKEGLTPLGDAIDAPASMARCLFQVVEPADEEAPGAVITFQLLPGTRLGLHTVYTLFPGQAELLIEQRLHNRACHAQPAILGFSLPPSFTAEGATVLRSGQTVLSLISPGLPYRSDGEGNLIADGGFLEPREWVAAKLEIRPVVGALKKWVHHEAITVSWESNSTSETTIRTVAHRAGFSGKMFLEDESGKSLEAPLEPTPEAPLEFVVPHGVRRLAVADANGQVILDSAHPPATPEPWAVRDPDLARHPLNVRLQDHAVRPDVSWARDRRFAAGVHQMRARLLIESGDLAGAVAAVEDALHVGDEDHLAWWLMAALKRREEAAQEDADQQPERTELLNAMFLAPLEPLCRAESFLEQGEAGGDREHPLLKPLANHPDLLVDVACTYLEFGLVRDAVRWLNAVIQMSPSPLLRLLLAGTLYEHTGLHADAAEQLQQALQAKVEPPFPWRREAVHAVQTLAEAFPKEEGLRVWVQLAEMATP